MIKKALSVISLVIFLSGCSLPGNYPLKQTSMQLTSSAFAANGKIPAEYTCDGRGKNPPLMFGGVPQGAQSLALIVTDPDAPVSGGYVHWTVWNIPPDVAALGEGDNGGGVEGVTTGRSIGYVPPCPPSGSHRYVFRIFALDKKLELSSDATNREMEKAMQGHVLDQAELIGLYSRK